MAKGGVQIPWLMLLVLVVVGIAVLAARTVKLPRSAEPSVSGATAVAQAATPTPRAAAASQPLAQATAHATPPSAAAPTLAAPTAARARAATAAPTHTPVAAAPATSSAATPRPGTISTAGAGRSAGAAAGATPVGGGAAATGGGSGNTPIGATAVVAGGAGGASGASGCTGVAVTADLASAVAADPAVADGQATGGCATGGGATAATATPGAAAVRGEVALTFDAGADRGYAEDILDILAQEHVVASFGITGNWAKANPDLVRRMAADGHMVFNHTLDHRSFTGVSDNLGGLSAARRRAELDDADNIIAPLIGHSTKPWYRLPYGDDDSQVAAEVLPDGYSHKIGWTVDSLGWRGSQSSDIVARCLKLSAPGAVYVLHVGRASQDAIALPQLIAGLRDRGFGFRRIDQA